MTKAEEFYTAKNKLAEYDKESNNLMLDAMEFEDAVGVHFSLPEIVYLLRKSFKERLTYYRVFQEDRPEYNVDPATGFCMVSSYLIYDMTGGDKVWELQGTNLHWWLYHKQSHSIFDITHTQFKDRDLPGIYRLGRPVQQLHKDDVFDEVLKEKAKDLAKCAGLR